MSDQELKPCPFCGSKNLAITASFGEWWVACNGCLAGTNMCISREESFCRWNTRTPDPMLEELAKALGSLLFECGGAFDVCRPTRETVDLGFTVLKKYQQSKVQS